MPLLILLFLILFGLLAYIRLAPMDVGKAHRKSDAKAAGDYPSTGGFEAVRHITSLPEEVLQGVMTQALNTPRTAVFAGGVEDGCITFVTRSKLIGFPDYTTVWIEPGDQPKLAIRGHLRFGRSDLGVNKARITEWLRGLGPLTVPL